MYKKDSQVLVGYLVDYMCGKNMAMSDVKKSDAKAARHTRECALDEACASNGYGLVTGGKFYKFDTTGNVKANQFLRTTKKENNILVQVAGKINKEIFFVTSIKDAMVSQRKGK